MGLFLFATMTLEDLEEVGAAMHEQWQLLGMSQAQLKLTSCRPSSRSKAGRMAKGKVHEVQPDFLLSPAPIGLDAGIRQTDLGPAEFPRYVSETSRPRWTLCGLPLTFSSVTGTNLDLQSNGSGHIEYAYRERTSVFLVGHWKHAVMFPNHTIEPYP